MPAANALCASVGAADCRLRGTEIAHWLLFTTNTTGNCQTPARFRLSRKSPLLVAPSPQVVTATRGCCRIRKAAATPQAWQAWVAMGTQMGKSSTAAGADQALPRSSPRSEERRVGKEGRSGLQ